MSIRVESRTDKGLIRSVNEDAIATLPKQGVVILADGMGGYNAGEVASHLAVETIVQRLQTQNAPDVDAMVSAVEAANDAIITAIKEQAALKGMATTIALAHFGEEKACFAYVGDSRIYRYRNGVLTQVSSDHSMAQELVDQGMFSSLDEAQEAGVKKNILTRGVGIDVEIKVDAQEQPIREGDLYLFCSDGLSDLVKDDEIQRVISRVQMSLAEKADQLVDMALSRGGKDNVSVILVGV